MKNSSIIIISIGIILFILSIVNSYSSNSFTPDFQRAEILSTISSIIIITIGLLFKQVIPKSHDKALLKGKQGFFINESLEGNLKLELAWGSQLILTATAAATLLIYWDNDTILKRGFMTDKIFIPDKICENSRKKGRLISLPNTNNYPNSYEFDSVLDNLPSILVYPLGNKGYVIVGGSSIRCFTKSDEIWISGWAEKILPILEKIN